MFQARLSWIQRHSVVLGGSVAPEGTHMTSALPPPMTAARARPVTVACVREALAQKCNALAWSPGDLERCLRDSALLDGASADQRVVAIAGAVRSATDRLSAGHRGRQVARRAVQTLMAGTGTAGAWWMLEHTAGLLGPVALLAVTAGVVSRGRSRSQMDRIKEQAVAMHLFMDGLERLHGAALWPASQRALEWYSWRHGSSGPPLQYRQGIALSYLDIFRQTGRPQPESDLSLKDPAWVDGLTWLAVHAPENAAHQLRALKDNLIALQRLRADKTLEKVRSLAIRLGLTRSDAPELFVDQYADALSKHLGLSWIRHLLPQAYRGSVGGDGFEVRYRMVSPAAVRPVGITEDHRCLEVALSGRFNGSNIMWTLDPDNKGPGGPLWAARCAEALLEGFGFDDGTLTERPWVHGQSLHIPPSDLRHVLLKLLKDNLFLDPAVSFENANRPQ
jgi:hypothetical protein